MKVVSVLVDQRQSFVIINKSGINISVDASV